MGGYSKSLARTTFCNRKLENHYLNLSSNATLGEATEKPFWPFKMKYNQGPIRNFE